LNDDVARRDRDEEFPFDFWKKLRCGWNSGLPVPPEYGGGGADTLTTVCALEALGYGCKGQRISFLLERAHVDHGDSVDGVRHRRAETAGTCEV